MFDLPVRLVWLIPAFGLSQYQRLLPSPNYQLKLFAPGCCRRRQNLGSSSATSIPSAGLHRPNRRSEADLDMPLFILSVHGVTLTPRGTHLQERL